MFIFIKDRLKILIFILSFVFKPLVAQNESLSQEFSNDFCTASSLETISSSLDLQKINLLPTAHFNEASQSWQNNDESSKVQLDQLACALAGSQSVNKHFGIAVLSAGDGLSIIWKVAGPSNNQMISLKTIQPVLSHSNQQSVTQYSNLYGLFHSKFQLTTDSVYKTFQILSPEQSIAFSVVDGTSPSTISSLCLTNTANSIQFVVFEWTSKFSSIPTLNFPVEVQCGNCSFRGLLFRLCPTVDSITDLSKLYHKLDDSAINTTMIDRIRQNFSAWEFCTEAAARDAKQQNLVYIPQCILSISPRTFDLAGSDESIEITITLDDYANIDLNSSPLSCWLTSANDAAATVNLNVKVRADKGDIGLSTSKKGIETETELVLHCTTTHSKRELLPLNTTILVTDYKKYVKYYAPTPTTFYMDDLQKRLTVVFSLALPTQFEYAPNCLVDSNDKSILLGAQAETLLVVSCDLSAHKLDVGYRSVWVIRSPDLWNVTLQSQIPLSIAVEQKPSTFMITSAAPAVIATTTTTRPTTPTTIETTASSTTVRPASHSPPATSPFVPQSIKFSDSLDSLLIEYNLPLGVTTKGNCSIVIADLSKFGTRPNCTMNSDPFVSVLLGPGATVRPNDTVLFRSFVANGLNFSLTSEQNFTTLRVGNPINGISPSVSLQPSKTVFGCEDEDMNITAIAVSGSGGRTLSCAWSVEKTDSQQIKSLVQTAKDCVLKIPASALTALRKTNANAMSVSASVCNFVQKCSQTESVAIGPDIYSGMIFSVKIAGIPTYPVSSIRITMSAQPSLTQCNSSASILLTGVSYTWVFNGNVSSSLQYTYTTQDSVVTIPSNFFEAGDIIVATLQGRYVLEEGSKRSLFNCNDTQIIKFATQPIVVVVDATSKSVASDDTLQIDASRSWSPNGATRELKHNWTCLNTTAGSTTYVPTTTTPPSTSQSNCVWPSSMPSNISWHNSVLIIPPNMLVTKGSFLFTNHVTDGANKSDTVIQVRVQVQSPKVPSIQLVALSSVEKEEEVQPETYQQREESEYAIQDVIQTKGGYIHFKAFIGSKSGDLTTEWKLFKQSDNSSVNLSFSSSQGKQNFSERVTQSANRIAVSLTLPTTVVNNEDTGTWKGLTPEEPYLLRLSARNAAGYSYADYMFCVHAPPFATKLLITPTKNIAALQTPVRISPAGMERKDLFMCQMKYGIKTLLVGNRSRTEWSRSTIADFYEILLPSAWPQPHAACGQRIGYQAVLEICDAWNACSLQESDTFVVDLALNSSGVLTQAIALIESRLANGDIYNAIELCASVIEEQCGSFSSSIKDLVDSAINRLMDLLEDTNDSDELLEGLDYAMKIVVYASTVVMDRVMELLERVKHSVGMPSSNSSAISITSITGFPRSARNKRSVNLMSTPATTVDKEVNEAAASTLLVAYDLLVGKNQDVVRVYLNNIQDILSDFCIQADDSRLLTASGSTYTEVQSQGVIPGATSFPNSSFTVAGTKLYLISFDTSFTAAFSNWACTNGTSCAEICLGTAQTLVSAIRDNQFLAAYFFSSQYNSVSLDQAVSDFYHVNLLDPISGSAQTLKPGAGYTIRLPISKYVASAYYKCLVFTSTIWEENSACQSADYPNLVGTYSTFQLTCHCFKTGIISVFTISPPTPFPYPLYNEVSLSFYLNTNSLPTTSQLNTFLDYLSSASGVDTQRFVGLNCSVDDANSQAVITLKLRPPFRDVQQTISYAMQSINRTVNIDGGFTAYEGVKVTSMIDSTVFRELIGDKNARRITLQIDRSFKDVVGTDAEGIASKWASKMAKNMRISEYRIKNAVVLTGMLFNFTITVPFEGESVFNSSVLSAEEIAKWIQEQVKYGEMDLTDSREQSLPVDPLTNADIIELKVLQDTTILMVWLAVLVPTVFVLTTFCAGGLVFVKIRTDKLIESHNANMTTIDISQTTPINVLPVDEREPRNAEDTNASDTVVFGRRSTGNRSKQKRK